MLALQDHNRYAVLVKTDNIAVSMDMGRIFVMMMVVTVMIMMMSD